MSFARSARTWFGTSLALLAALLVFAGCSKKEEESSTPPATGGAPKTTTAKGEGPPGKAIFAGKCVRCHAIDGQGGRMGPDLTHTGADATHTSQWIADHIKNPKTHNPNSRMPAFEGQINEKDLTDLADYLAGLK